MSATSSDTIYDELLVLRWQSGKAVLDEEMISEVLPHRLRLLPDPARVLRPLHSPLATW